MNDLAGLAGLPSNVAIVLSEFLQSLESNFKDNLRSVVLYGSAAEGKLRLASDVNLLVILKAFEQGSADSIREQMRRAEAAIHLRAMFVLESELPEAATAFAQKFVDIKRRYRVILGPDLITGLQISRESEIARLRQVLLNLQLRMRSVYVLRSQRGEQLAHSLAEFSGPLRTCAAAILELQGRPAASPKDALAELGAGYASALATVSAAREGRDLAAGEATSSAFQLLELAGKMRELAKGLR